MPLPFVPNGMEAVVVGTWDGQLTNNTLWFIGPTNPPTFLEVATLANDLLSWYVTSMIPNLNEAFTLNKVRAKSFGAADGPVADAFAVDVVGANTGEAVPNNVDPCITFRSATGGRSGHGRNYIPAMGNSDVNGNMLDAVTAGNIITAYNQIIDGGGAELHGLVWSIVSYRTAGAVRPVPFSFPVTQVGFTDLIVDSQRRRLPGRGR